MAIKVTLTGFEDLLKQIDEANGKMEAAAERCVRESAEIMQAELKNAMNTSKGKADAPVSESLVNRMPSYTITSTGARVTAHVGYPETSYNPRHPSDYHQAIFANYGTPHRKKHGHEQPRGFIQKAKRAARTKIKRQQEETLNNILKDLKA